jgi:hypothetical protein
LPATFLPHPFFILGAFLACPAEPGKRPILVDRTQDHVEISRWCGFVPHQWPFIVIGTGESHSLWSLSVRGTCWWFEYDIATVGVCMTLQQFNLKFNWNSNSLSSSYKSGFERCQALKVWLSRAVCLCSPGVSSQIIWTFVLTSTMLLQKLWLWYLWERVQVQDSEIEDDWFLKSKHGELCCWETGWILLSMGALVKDPGPPKLGTWDQVLGVQATFRPFHLWSRRLRSVARVHHPVWLVRANDQRARRPARRQ